MKIAEARAVVTGGASGLGNAVARHKMPRSSRWPGDAPGCGRPAPGARPPQELGARAQAFVKCDVTSEAEVDRGHAGGRRSDMGGINLLVNCAGVIGAARVLGRNGPMAAEFFTKVIHINLIGTFLCDKAAAALMQKEHAPTRMASAAC